MATNDDDEHYTSSSWKIFKFDGNKSKFGEWKIKTKAYARRKKFAKAYAEYLMSTKDDGNDKIKMRETRWTI
jgi:hypothetical protein